MAFVIYNLFCAALTLTLWMLEASDAACTIAIGAFCGQAIGGLPKRKRE